MVSHTNPYGLVVMVTVRVNLVTLKLHVSQMTIARRLSD